MIFWNYPSGSSRIIPKCLEHLPQLKNSKKKRDISIQIRRIASLLTKWEGYYMQNGSKNIVVDDVAVKFLTQDRVVQALYLTSVPPYSRHTLSDIKLLFRWRFFTAKATTDFFCSSVTLDNHIKRHNFEVLSS